MPKAVKQARTQAKKVEKLTQRVEKREAAGKGTARAEKKLAKVQPRLQATTEKVQQRVGRRQAAGKQAKQAERVLGRSQRALGGVPNFTGAPPGIGGAAGPGAPEAAPPTPPPQGPPAAPAAPASNLPANFTPPAGATGTQAPGAPPPPPTFTQALTQQFGQSNPFAGQAANVGNIASNLAAPGAQFAPSSLFGNPLETAQARAQNLLDQNLAGINAGMASQGNSSRAALMRGAAIGEASTNLGDILAQRGLQQRQTDMDRLLAASGQQGAFQQQDVGRQLQAMLGAGQLEQGQQGLNQQAQQLAMQGLGGLGQQGIGLTGIGVQEQQIPGLSGALGLLGSFGNTESAGTSRNRTTSGKYI